MLWYIGSAMGPARSKSWVAGKPFSWNGWWSEQQAGVRPSSSSGLYREETLATRWATSGVPILQGQRSQRLWKFGKDDLRVGEGQLRAFPRDVVGQHIRLDHKCDIRAAITELTYGSS